MCLQDRLGEGPKRMQVSGTQQLFDSHSVDGQRCYKSGSWGLPLTSMETSASTTLPLSIDFRTVSVPLDSPVSEPALLSPFLSQFTT